jgi:outer membrane protein assembly factor BamB
LVYVVREHCDVVAYDLVGGNRVWQSTLPAIRAGADVFLDGDRLYVLSGDVLEIHDALLGTVVGRVEGLIEQGASCQAGVLYGFTSGGRLTAFDVRREVTLWTANGTFNTLPAPVVAGPTILVSGCKPRPCAFDARTGLPLWTAEVEETVAEVGSFMAPVVLGNVAYTRVLFSGKLYSVALSDGRVLGYLDTRMSPIVWGETSARQPIVVGDVLIVPVGSDVYAYGK